MVYVRVEMAERPCAQTGRRQVAESVELQPHKGMNVNEKMGRELRPVQPLRCLIRKKKVTEKKTEISLLFVTVICGGGSRGWR